MAKTVVLKCPKCKTEVEIKGNSKSIKSKVTASSTIQSFPTHNDCELARPIHKMDFSKLQKVREE